jgi:hypothetical protein
MSDQRIWMTVGKGAGRLLTEGNGTDQISNYGTAWSSLAVDGHTESTDNYYDGHISGNYYAGFTTHTDVANNPWWTVDFGPPRLFEQMHVWNRTDCCANRLREWSVLTSNDYVNWTEIYKDFYHPLLGVAQFPSTATTEQVHATRQSRSSRAAKSKATR